MIVDIISDGIIWVDVPSVHWVSPFWKRVIESHLQTFGAYCISEFADDVTFRTADDAVPFWRILTIPEAIAIVMFCHEKHIFRAALLKQICPVRRIPELCLEHFVEVAISEVFAVVSLLEINTSAVVVHQSAVIPFSITFVGSKSRDRIYAPVNEDSEFCIGEPLWITTLLQRFPCCFNILSE